MKYLLFFAVAAGICSSALSVQDGGNMKLSDFSEYAAPARTAFKFSAETTEEYLKGATDKPIPPQARSIYNAVIAPGFAQYVLDFDPRDLFFTRNPDDTNAKRETLKTKDRYVFNGTNFKYYYYGTYDRENTFKTRNKIFISKDTFGLASGDFLSMMLGKYFFPADFPFYNLSGSPVTVADILASSPHFKSRNFPKCEIIKSGNNATIKSDGESGSYECVLALNPLMLKSYKRTYKPTGSRPEKYTVAYEFSGEISLPWNNLKIPSKITRISFNEADMTGNKFTISLKSIEAVKNFDIKKYDTPPQEGGTVHDKTKKPQ